MAPNSSTDGESFSSSATQPTVMSEVEYYDMKGEYRRQTVDGDTDSDKDLVITSLTESLQIHKEILERLNNEKEAFIADMRKERSEEQAASIKEKEETMQRLQAQMERYQQLESAYSAVVKELESKKEEYKRMESNFYAHVKSIRPTDDDLSTIQYEITHLHNQLNNFCMGLKSKMDRSGGAAYILERWPKAREHFVEKNDDDEARLEPWIITMFTEKLITEALSKEIFDQPIHTGVSINDTFKQLNAWIEERNTDWAIRLRQQVSALVVRQAGGEQSRIDTTMESVVDGVLDQLANIYPRVKEGPQQKKKMEAICARAAKLNLAMKGQDIRVFCGSIEEGIAQFDSSLMKASSKSTSEGTVMFVISPPFIALDPKDEEHGFVIPAKVYCDRLPSQ